MQYYFKVTNPEGKQRIILAYDKHHAIEVAVGMDKHFFENWEYSAIIAKI